MQLRLTTAQASLPLPSNLRSYLPLSIGDTPSHTYLREGQNFAFFKKMTCWASRQVRRSSYSNPRKTDGQRKHSQSKADSRRCPAQTQISAKGSAAVPRCSVELATTSREAPSRDSKRRSAFPNLLSFSLADSPADCPSDSRSVRPQLYIQPCQSNSLDCKSCRDLDVLCDHTRPQCTHCYQQQTLCFYVSSKQRSKSKA